MTILFIALLFDCVIVLVFSCLLCALQPDEARKSAKAARVVKICFALISVVPFGVDILVNR